MHKSKFGPSPFPYQTTSEYFPSKIPKVPKGPLAFLFSNFSITSSNFQEALEQYQIAEERKIAPNSEQTSKFSEIEDSSLPLPSMFSEYGNTSLNIFSPFENRAFLHGISTELMPHLNEGTLNKSFLSRENPNSLSNMEKVFYEPIISEDANSSYAKNKPNAATNKLWCKDGLITKIKDYKNGLLYQKEILKATKEDVDQVIDELFKSMPELILDKYSNYFLVNLVFSCTISQRLRLLHSISGNLFNVCLSKYGIHPIQAFFNAPLSKDEELIFRDRLQGKIVSLALNEYGTFIVMKLMPYIITKEDTIFQEILDNFIMLSQTEKGLNVVKSLVVSLKDSIAQTLIITVIKEKAQMYIENQYSNYALQMIIKLWPFIVTQPLFLLILSHVPYYSLQQCSSNVVEAIINNAPEEYRIRYINEVIESKELIAMMINIFGCFVLQKMIDTANAECKIRLLNVLESNLGRIRSNKMKKKWVKLCNAKECKKLSIAIK